jgi:uncharacterized protein (TIGR02246 family)
MSSSRFDIAVSPDAVVGPRRVVRFEGTASSERAQRVSAIAESNRRFVDASAQHDARTMASVYTEDADLLAPNAGRLRGRTAIEEFWRGGIEMGIRGVELKTLRVEGSENFVCESGRYTLHFEPQDGAPVTDEATYVVLHRLERDGIWRRTAEIFTWSVPLE